MMARSSGVPPTASRDRDEATRSTRWRDGPLYDLLQTTNRLKAFLESSSAAVRGIACCLALGLLAVFTDAVLGLPTAGRIAADAVLIAGLLAVPGILVAAVVRNRFRPERTARLVEERLDLRNSLFVNAVDFSANPAGAQSAGLRDRAVRLAEERAASMSSLDILPFSPLYRALAIAAGVAVFILVSYAAAPRVFGMVVPRLLDPRGDHPPYSLVEFDVRITPEPVYHGRAAVISVTLGGPETVEQAAVVFTDSAERESVPMARGAEREFSLQIDRADVSRRFHIDTPRGRSRTYALEVTDVPFFEEVRISAKPPEYTGWPPQEYRLDARGLRALVGTEFTLTARSNLPLKSGMLVLTPESGTDAPAAPVTIECRPLPDDPRGVAGTFTIAFSGRFELSLTGTNGATSFETVEGKLTALPDRFPSVAITSPAPYVVVVENWKADVVVEALDDVGISQLRMYRSVNSWGPAAAELAFDRPRPNSARAVTTFDLPALGARAGDIITYYVSAWDNHPGNDQFRDSETHVIQVISQEEYEQFARQQYQMAELVQEFDAIRESLDKLQAEREALLEELRQLREQLADGATPSAETLAKMQELEQGLKKYGEHAAELAERLKERTGQLQLYELEEPYADMLRELSDDLSRQAGAAQQTSEALKQLQQQPESAGQRKAFDDAAQQLQEQDKPFGEQSRSSLDAAERDMELYQMADSLIAQSDRLRSIIARQREVADRLAEFQNQNSLAPEDQARADQFAKDQELLEQELQDTVSALRESAARSAERLPKMSASAQQICDKIEGMEIRGDQQSAASAARAGLGRPAHEAAESAARKLESLASECAQCQGAAGEMCDSLDGPLSLSQQRLAQCLKQLQQGRMIPGLGQKPGRGDGGGMLGQNGRSGNGGTAQGNMPGPWRPGQSFRGSQAPITVLGPHSAGDDRSPSGRLDGQGRGDWLPFGSEYDPLGAETLDPETRESRQSGAGNLRGVPVPYREAAEAYFRRLAEEHRP